MTLTEQTVALFKALEQQDWHQVQEMVADDFQYVGPTPDPFDKETWVDFQIAVHKAFPDWQYNIQKIEEAGNKVNIQVHITGTHTETLALPLEGVAPLPATQKKIELPVEEAHLEFRGDQVVKLVVDQQMYGSLPGLLNQLGLE